MSNRVSAGTNANRNQASGGLSLPSRDPYVEKMIELLERNASGEEIIALGVEQKRTEREARRAADAAAEKAKNDRMQALTLNMQAARYKHEGAGSAYIQSLKAMRQADLNGNKDPLLQTALDKYDYKRQQIPSTSSYVLPDNEMDRSRQLAKKGDIYAITQIDSFLERYYKTAKLVNRQVEASVGEAAGNRTERQENIRGGIILLADTYKENGNSKGLQDLKDRVLKDQRLKGTLMQGEIENTFDSTFRHNVASIIHLPKYKERSMAVVETLVPSPVQTSRPSIHHIVTPRTPGQDQRKTDLATFENSFERLREKNKELSESDFAKLATTNLQNKKYNPVDIDRLAKEADRKGNILLAKVLRESLTIAYNGKMVA